MRTHKQTLYYEGREPPVFGDINIAVFNNDFIVNIRYTTSTDLRYRWIALRCLDDSKPVTAGSPPQLSQLTQARRL